MDKDALVASVKSEIAKWVVDSHPYAYNTSSSGRSHSPLEYGKFPDVSKEDFDAAVIELKEHVRVHVLRYSGRSAMSLSGREAGYNIWSFLIEPCGGNNTRKFNYHAKVVV